MQFEAVKSNWLSILVWSTKQSHWACWISSIHQLQGFMGDTLRCVQVFACGDYGLHTDRKLISAIQTMQSNFSFMVSWSDNIWPVWVNRVCLKHWRFRMWAYAHMSEGLDFSLNGSLHTSCLLTRVDWGWTWSRTLLNHSWQLPVWRFVCVLTAAETKPQCFQASGTGWRQTRNPLVYSELVQMEAHEPNSARLKC